MGRKYTAGIRTRVRTAVGPLFEMLHIYMVLARLCKTHTYPVWGMTMLRQFRSPPAAPVSAHSCACIYDVPIESIALPDPSDRYYSSALVKRLEIQTRNQSNRAKRLTIVFNTRTRLFGMLIRSVKTNNPGFAQEMTEVGTEMDQRVTG